MLGIYYSNTMLTSFVLMNNDKIIIEKCIYFNKKILIQRRLDNK